MTEYTLRVQCAEFGSLPLVLLEVFFDFLLLFVELALFEDFNCLSAEANEMRTVVENKSRIADFIIVYK